MARWVVDLLVTALRAFIERTTIVNCGPAHFGHYALAEVGDELEVSFRDG